MNTKASDVASIATAQPSAQQALADTQASNDIALKQAQAGVATAQQGVSDTQASNAVTNSERAERGKQRRGAIRH